MVTERSGVGDGEVDSSSTMGEGWENPDTFAPWWIDGKKQCYLGKKGLPKTKELWEDVYAVRIRYKLMKPLQAGRMQKEDTEAMKKVWGYDLQILLAVCSW